MKRMFDEHRVRQTADLGGMWRFCTDPEDRGEELGWQKKLPENARRMSVPSVWNTTMGLLEYEGCGWYERSFETVGGTLRFWFGGVMTRGTVWLDGVELGYHDGGFTAFERTAFDVAPGEHTLTVRADNRFDDDSIPQVRVDWYHYGGITRDIEVSSLHGICILQNRMEYTLNGNKAEITPRVKLINAENEAVTDTVRILVEGKELTEYTVTLQPREEREIYLPAAVLEDVTLWCPETPRLYAVAAETSTDDLLDRTGFRTVEVKDGKILLNGKPIEIRGACRHEEHPDWGFAFPAGLMEKDLDILEDMGANALRGSHYPNQKAFVDLLDERGIYFWSEIPIWGSGFEPSDLGNLNILALGLEMHREMTDQYYNHPSIIIWGCHNEIPSDSPESVTMTKLYSEKLRAWGGNRLVTHASNIALKDICYEYDDIICLNQYIGWYGGGVEEWEPFLGELHEHLRELGQGGKPIVFSEFGAAALYGNHTFDNVPWSEEYQANLFDHCLGLFRADEKVCGYYVWQFCDIRTSRQMGTDRARSFNNKGIMNEYRKPKAAYFAIKNRYQAFKKENGEK